MGKAKGDDIAIVIPIPKAEQKKDGMPSPHFLKVRTALEAWIKDRKIGKVVGSGAGQGTMDVQLTVGDADQAKPKLQSLFHELKIKDAKINVLHKLPKPPVVGETGAMVVAGLQEDLDDLARKDILTALRHPEASPEQLSSWIMKPMGSQTRGQWEAEMQARLEALESNPSLDLLLLENPAVMEKALWIARDFVASRAFQTLLLAQPRDVYGPFVLQVAEKVLLLEENPKDAKTCRLAIDLGRTYLHDDTVEGAIYEVLKKMPATQYIRLQGRLVVQPCFVVYKAVHSLWEGSAADAVDCVLYARNLLKEQSSPGELEVIANCNYWRVMLRDLQAMIRKENIVGGRKPAKKKTKAKQPHRVGMSSEGKNLEILRDPNSTADQLIASLDYNKYRGLRDRLAVLEENPALPLLFLEDASAFAPLPKAYWSAKLVLAQEALGQALQRLPTKEFQDRAIRVAAEVLPLYEAKRPHETSPRECIAEAIRFQKGQATEEELEVAIEDADTAASLGTPAEGWPAMAACWAGKVCLPDTERSAWPWICAARAKATAKEPERSWPWGKLVVQAYEDYLRQLSSPVGLQLWEAGGALPKALIGGKRVIRFKRLVQKAMQRPKKKKSSKRKALPSHTPLLLEGRRK